MGRSVAVKAFEFFRNGEELGDFRVFALGSLQDRLVSDRLAELVVRRGRVKGNQLT